MQETLVIHVLGHYLTVKGSASTYGQVAVIVSPPMTFKTSIILHFELSAKMREEDELPEFTAFVFNDNNYTSLTFKYSTDGFVSQTICSDPGRVMIAFQAVWGFYSSPFFALDNITVIPSGAACGKV
jgi:hypothetical protein